MFEAFKTYILHYINLSEDDLALIESVARPKKLRKRQYLLQEGDVSHHHYFIVKGLLREYSVDEKGEEHVFRFAKENEWIADCESLYIGTPSKYNIDAIEDTELLVLEKEDKAMLMEKLPAFGKLINDLKNKYSAVSQNRIHESITHNSAQKYDNFVNEYPEYALRVPQAMIASYLGIKPETLSRLRKHH
jgi:CRP-like cAMP-binding protein